MDSPLRQLVDRAGAFLQIGVALRFVWNAASGWMIANLLLLVIQGILPLVGLYLIKLIVDEITVATGTSGDGATFTGVLWLIVLAALVALVTAVARAVSTYVSEVQSELVTDHVTDILQEKSARVDFGYYEDPRYFDTLHRAQQEAPYRPTRLLGNLSAVSQNAITAVGIVILLATVHWILAVVILVAVFPALIVRTRFANRLHAWQKERASTVRTAQYVSWILTQAQHAKEIRVFGLGPELRKRYQNLRKKIREERLQLARRVGAEAAMMQIGASLVVFGSLAFIAWRTVSGTLTVGDLVMYFGAIQRGQSTLQGLFSGLGSLYEDNLFLTNLSEFMQIEERIVARHETIPMPTRIQEGIELHDVSFQYPLGARSVLQGVSLRVRPGEMVALVGSNGSGKTSLVKLLCRLYDPDEGSVTLDGIDIRDLDPDAYRQRIGVVFQDYAKYNLSAADNIGFGNRERMSERDRIESAAQTAGVADVIARLPRGYETILGRVFKEGEELSIGEWQKVALARAFFSDADILVVDEPTSSLDAEAEAEIFQSLRDLIRNRIAFVISHRFSTVRMADRIYVLDAGRIIESGNHEELMALGGRYAHLFNVQAAPYQSTEAYPDLTAQGATGSRVDPFPGDDPRRPDL